MAKPKRIILIRHGQSGANADKNVREHVPDHEIELTEIGWDQAKTEGKDLSDIVRDEKIQLYLSPYRRTRQTFEGILAGSRANNKRLDIVKIYEDPRIREQDFGHLRPLKAFKIIDEERARYGTFFYRIKDGESGADCYDRVSDFLNTMHRDFAKPDFPENAMMISHGLTIRLFCMRWFHWSVEHFERLRNPSNCEHFILELQPDDKYKLITPFRLYSPEETLSFRGVDPCAKVTRPWMQ
jgi:broad specificity phosphatase PhoE